MPLYFEVHKNFTFVEPHNTVMLVLVISFYVYEEFKNMEALKRKGSQIWLNNHTHGLLDYLSKKEWLGASGFKWQDQGSNVAWI